MGVENEIQKAEKKPITLKGLFDRDDVKVKFQEMLGKRATQFMVSVLQVVQSNEMLKNADPMSIYQAAAIAATLDLPINNSLGLAYIVPFNTKQKDGSYKVMAQFMIGYKGFIQLAQRSGQLKSIGACAIYEGQILEANPLTGYTFDFTQKTSEIIIGYAAYFEMLNGFSKTLYMSIIELTKHGAKFSQTFKKGFGLWKDDFESMAIKTVIKLLISKYAPLSVELQRAVLADQAIISEGATDEPDYQYPDNEDEIKTEPKAERFTLMLADCKTIADVESLVKQTKAITSDQEFQAEEKKMQIREAIQ